jgi:NADH-quinone oxidoreductase subunit I
MIGLGILKGLGVTIKHFFSTYWADIALRNKPEGKHGTAKSTGLFTVQYPEESVLIPEEFRVIPFLVYTLGEDRVRNYRCTACGICSKVCPTQCIWITRKKDEVTGKPIAASEDFFIDVDKCMNCGTCAEFCPFDAIKMDHDFQIASYTRGETHIYNKERLGKPLEYYAKIRPMNFAEEESVRAAKAAAKAE